MTIKRYTVKIEEEAQLQIEDLEIYICEHDSPKTASEYCDRIYDFCESLSTFPKRFTHREDIRKGFYEAGFERRATITYSVDDTTDIVSVFGVYYGGQDWEAHL